MAVGLVVNYLIIQPIKISEHRRIHHLKRILAVPQVLISRCRQQRHQVRVVHLRAVGILALQAQALVQAVQPVQVVAHPAVAQVQAHQQVQEVDCG